MTDKKQDKNKPDCWADSASGYIAKVTLPAGAFGANEFDSLLDTILRKIGKKFESDGGWGDKYGSEVDGEIFMMHPFCWREQDNCAWCGGEIVPELMKGFSDDNRGAPNFWYKPLDFKVWWYKYIGRGVETNKELKESELDEILNKCMAL